MNSISLKKSDDGIFQHQVNNKLIQLYKPTQWGLRTINEIIRKTKINKIDLSRYILYYSQVNYKKEKHINFTFFYELGLKTLQEFFCEYIKSDKDTLDIQSISSIDNIEAGVELLLKKINTSNRRMASTLILGRISMDISTLWLEAIEGKHNEFNSEKLREEWQRFKNKIIPKLEITDASRDTVENIISFIDNKSEIYLRYAEVISMFINDLRDADLWIPSRFVESVAKDLLELKIENIRSEFLPNLIFELSDEQAIHSIKKTILNNDLFQDRKDIIEKIFLQFESKKYYSVISLGLTQIDYLVYELVKSLGGNIDKGYTNKIVIEELLKYLEDIKNHTTINKFMPIFEDFSEGFRIIQFISLTNYLRLRIFRYVDFLNGSANEDELHRHSILHGKTSKYGSYSNSLRIILLLDDLLFIKTFYIDKKEFL